MANESCETAVRVAALCGSLRPGSYTRMALQAALDGAAESGCETDLIDLGEFHLPFAGAPEGAEPGDAARLRERIRSADGILLGTPEYHGSFSGVLKNALDLTGFPEWEGKMLGLVGVSGGRMGAHEALNSLRQVGRALHAWVIPEQVSIPEAWKRFDGQGRLQDGELSERLLDAGRQVARFARLHKCAAARDFLVNWEKAQENPGA
jgi:NAD(P)H-dependent FMN reductase